MLKRRAPAAVGGGGSVGDRAGHQQLRADEVTAMLTCLHPVANNVSPGLATEIMQCLSNCQQLLHKQAAIGSSSAHSSVFPSSAVGGVGGGSGLLAAVGSQQSNPLPFGHPPQRSMVDAFPGGPGGGLTPLMSRVRFQCPPCLVYPYSISSFQMDLGSGTGGNHSVASSSGFGDFLGSGSGSSLRNPFGTVTPTPSAFGQHPSSVSPIRSMMQSTFGSAPSVTTARFGVSGAGWGPTGSVGFRPPTVGSSAGVQSSSSNLGSIAGAGGNLGGATPSSISDSWGQPGSSAETLISQNFPEDVQEEANSYFQSIYNVQPPQTDAIPDFLETLKQFQKSGVKKQQVRLSKLYSTLFK